MEVIWGSQTWGEAGQQAEHAGPFFVAYTLKPSVQLSLGDTLFLVNAL